MIVREFRGVRRAGARPTIWGLAFSSVLLVAGASIPGVVPSQLPFPTRTPPLPGRGEGYGTPDPVDLLEISSGIHERKAVRTKGTLAILDQRQGTYFSLSEGGGRVVVIPLSDNVGELRSLNGRRVEVVGYVRRLVVNQGTCTFLGQTVPQSICDNPDLPPTPDLNTPERTSWPTESITVWSGTDLTPFDGRPKEAPAGRLGDLLSSDPPSRERVTIVGRFCGANLCGGLTTSAPSAEAWVLQDEEVAVWVVGRPPRGKGWSLDPTYKPDTARWIAVDGQLERCGAMACLRAKRVTLVARPAAEPPE